MFRLVHVMIRVLNAERSEAFYRDCFGFYRVKKIEFVGFSLIYLADEQSDCMIELTVNAAREEPYAHGEAYGHIGLTTDDLERSHAAITAAGHAPGPIRSLAGPGGFSARFFFVTDPDGYKIEVLERGGMYI